MADSPAAFRLRQLTIVLGSGLETPGYHYVLLEDALEALTAVEQRAQRLLDTIEACQAASDAAVKEKGAIRSYIDGVPALDVAIDDWNRAQVDLRAVLPKP